MKASTTELIKFLKLQRRLGDTKRGVTGLLELLWLATARQAPRGDIGRHTNEDIAILCDWQGDPDLLVDALVGTGWLDVCSVNRLVIHDWKDHAPNYVKAALQKRMMSFAVPVAVPSGDASGDASGECSPERSGDASGERSQVTSEPSPEGTPNQAKSNQAKSNTSANASHVAGSRVDQVENCRNGEAIRRQTARGGRNERTRSSEKFERFWAAYPLRKDRLDAERAFSKACLKADPEHLIAQAKKYAEAMAGRDFVKHAATWLNKGSYMDDPAEWSRINGNSRTDDLDTPEKLMKHIFGENHDT